MISEPQVIDLLGPAAASILSADATAISRLLERKSAFADLDHQPAMTAMANERRAIVATDMRKLIAPEHRWELIDDHLLSGAYEWRVKDVVVRLSKTTETSRQRASAWRGPQAVLFETKAERGRDIVLIRLMGNVFTGATIDVARLEQDGSIATAIPLTSIAATQTVALPATPEPARTTVRLPGAGDIVESS
jgi:hypothetical protein